MRSRFLFCAALFLVPLQLVYANGFSGSWTGEGIAVMNPDLPHQKKRICSEIGIALDRRMPDRLDLNAGYYLCEDLRAEYGSAVFEVRDGIVFWEGRRVGKLSDSLLELEVLDPDDGVLFRLRLELEQERLSYLEEWIEDGRVRLRISGALRSY